MINLRLALVFVLALPLINTVVNAAEASSQGWQSYHECDSDGSGCDDDEWCDKGRNPRKCWAKRANGRSCNRNEKCLSNCCNEYNKCAECPVVDKCGGVHCPDGKVCDPDNGQCVTVDKCADVHCPDGKACNPQDGRCAVVDKCAGAHCPDGKTCDPGNGQCVADNACSRDTDCEYGEYCSDAGLCEPIPCMNVHCPDGEACNPENDLCFRVCSKDTDCEYGEFCSDDDLCEPIPCMGCPAEGRYCYENICYQPNFCYGVTCPDGKVCVDGECTRSDPCSQSHVSCRQRYWCWDGTCYPPHCDPTIPDTCPSGFSCHNNSCQMNAQCHIDEHCSGARNVCLNGVCIAECTKNDHCLDDEYCDTTTKRCVEKLATGGHCQDHQACKSSFCHRNSCHSGFDNGRWCDHDYECASKVCHAGTNYCIDPLRVGLKCTRNEECESDICSCFGAICQARLKREGMQCDLSCQCDTAFCHDGFCKKRFGLGQSCEEDSECESGMCDTSCSSIWRSSCGSFLCVPINGEIGDFCTESIQCKSELCKNQKCSQHEHDFFDFNS